jgi:uncharacterized HAD superfamily protein
MVNKKRNMKIHIISDIDGTLTTNPEFVRYNIDSNPCVIDYLQKKVDEGAYITYLSARNEFMRERTLQWFEQNHVPKGNLLLDAPMSEQRGKVIIPTLCKDDEICIYVDDNEKARLAAKQTLTNRIQVLDPLECAKFK